MTFYNRAGVAFAEGAPLGAAVDIAKSTPDEGSARVAGRAFGVQAPNAFGVTQAQVYAGTETGDADLFGGNAWQEPANDFLQKKVVQPIGSGVSTAMRWVGKPAELASDYVETNVRYLTGSIKDAADERGVLGAIDEAGRLFSPGAGGLPSFFTQAFLTPEWTQEWANAQAAESSPAQTMWEAIRSFDESEPFALLDDETRREERQEYFSSGAARWVTGTVDAGYALFNDPLVVAGSGVSAVRKAANAIKVTDVAAAARGADNLTVGGRRIRSTVDRVVDASETIRANSAVTGGGYADLAGTKIFGQTADAGAIPAILRTLDNEVDDAARVALKKDALYAGMGDKEALARLEARNAELALDLESMVGPNRQSAVESLLSRRNFSHLENLRAVDEDGFYDRVVSAYSDEIASYRDSLKRVETIGDPAGTGATSGARVTTAQISSLTGTRDVMRVGKTISRGRALPPLHIVTGRSIPGSFDLASHEAPESFLASVNEAQRMFSKSPSAQKLFGDMADEFSLALNEDAIVGAAGASRGARREIVDRFTRTMDKNLAHRLADGDGTREQQLLTLIREIRTRRTDSMKHMVERSYRSSRSDGNALVADQDGVYAYASEEVRQQFRSAFDASQLDAVVSLPSYREIERVVRANLPKGRLDGFVRRTANGTMEVGEEALAVVSDFWKFSVLFRAGYTIRNMVDGTARQIALMGPLKVMTNALRGAGNTAYNLRRVPVEAVELAQRQMQAQARLDNIFARYGDDLDDTVRAEVDDLRAILDEKLDPKMLSGEKTTRRGTELAQYLGKGPDRGSAYRTTAQFTRETGMIDARESVLGLMDTARTTSLRGFREADAVRNVPGSHPQWTEAYTKVVNQQIRNSHPLNMLMAGESDDAVIAWYKTDPSGRAQWAALKDKYERIEDLVAVQRDQLDTLLPEGRIRSLAAAGPLTAKQAEEAFETQAARPLVPARALELDSTNKIVQGYNTLRSTYFKWAAEVPETMMSRHPFYVDRKLAHMQQMAGDVPLEGMTVDQYNNLERIARVRARKDVGQYMFDTTHRSNMGHAMRFMSPFYAAWSDTMRKWARIAGENLEIVPQAPKIFMAPQSAFVVQDQDGNRILKNGDVVDSDGNVIRQSSDWTEGSIIIPMPQWLPKWADPGEGGAVKISKGSLNVIFQGDPFWLPGFGPLVAIPTNEVAKRAFPELYAAGTDPDRPVDDTTAIAGALLRHVLPMGLTDENVLSQTAPAYGKNLWEAFMGGERFDQTYAMLMAEEVNAQNLGERPQMTQAELESTIANRTRNWYLLRFLGSQAPFSTQPTSRLDFYRQEYQRYQREYGGEAKERFYEAYPDYFEASISLSANETGITATDDSWNMVEQYRGEIKANPKYGWMFVGAANMEPGFNSGVYTAQKAEGLRGRKDPREAFVDLQESQGWLEYQKLDLVITNALQERKEQGGSAALTATSNADIKAARDEMLMGLKQDNVQWANAYDSSGSGESIDEFFRTADQAMADRPELRQRSDFQLLSEYRQMRAIVKEYLAQQGLSSLSSEAATPIREIWEEMLFEMAESDIGFQQMYTRAGLDRDDLTGGWV